MAISRSMWDSVFRNSRPGTIAGIIPIPSSFKDLPELIDWTAQAMDEIGRLPLDYKSICGLREDVNMVVEEIIKKFSATGTMLRIRLPSYFTVSQTMSMMPLSRQDEHDLYRAYLARVPAETTFGEITAFRMWRVATDGILVSTFKDAIWKPGEVLEAHDSPANGSQFGIHGWKSVVEAVEYGKEIQDSRHLPPYYKVPIAFGRVKLWGEVIEHQRGYRAQFARIVGIDDVLQSPVAKHSVCKYDVAADEIQSHRPWSEAAVRQLQERYFPDQRKPQA